MGCWMTKNNQVADKGELTASWASHPEPSPGHSAPASCPAPQSSSAVRHLSLLLLLQLLRHLSLLLGQCLVKILRLFRRLTGLLQRSSSPRDWHHRGQGQAQRQGTGQDCQGQDCRGLPSSQHHHDWSGMSSHHTSRGSQCHLPGRDRGGLQYPWWLHHRWNFLIILRIGRAKINLKEAEVKRLECELLGEWLR